MDDNKLRFGVGVLVIAAIGIGIILTFLFGAFPTVLNREYTVSVWFPSAEGVSTNTPVLRDGVKIGRVSDIELVQDFNQKPEGGVILTLQLDQEYRLTHEYVPRIGIGSFITGDSKLEFVQPSRRELVELLDGDLDLIQQPYTDGEHFENGIKASDPFSVVFGLEDELRKTMKSVRGAGESIEDAGKSVRGLVGDLRTVIGIEPIATQDSARWRSGEAVRLTQYRDANRASTLTQQTDPPPDDAAPQPRFRIAPRNEATIVEAAGQAVRTLEEIQGAVRDVRQIVSDPSVRENLQESMDRLPKFLDEATTTLESAGETFKSFEQVGMQFRDVGVAAEDTINNIDETVTDAAGKIGRTLGNLDKTFENVERFTEPLGARGGQLVEQVLRSLANLDNAVVEIQSVGQLINRNDGTIRRLIEDDDLYYDVLRTVENIEMASARLRPILDDIRVFTDKVARDPRQLGVRGALNNRPSGLGLK